MGAQQTLDPIQFGGDLRELDCEIHNGAFDRLEPIVRRRLAGFYGSPALQAVLDKAGG